MLAEYIELILINKYINMEVIRKILIDFFLIMLSPNFIMENIVNIIN